jgi:spectinomycin phosphotransferase
MREAPAIEEELLRVCLHNEYALTPANLEFLSLGLDYSAGVYRVTSERGEMYLLKTTSRLLYEPSYRVPAYLHEQGIASVVAPILTKSGRLWTQIRNWVVVLYPWISGESSFTGMTDAQWRDLGNILRHIHQVKLPASGFESLRKERFDPTHYAQWIRSFEDQYLHAHGSESVSRRMLRACWVEQQSVIHTIMVSLEKLAPILQKSTMPLVICHADLHPGNLIRDHLGRIFVIDWDEVMLAPKERDFIFIRGSLTDSETLPGATTFFQGYGQKDIDWTALTYYRYERVIQDVITCAEDVFLRDDLGEESRLGEAQLFQDVLAPGGEIDAALSASAQRGKDA